MATPQELQIADWVAEFVEREFGTVPGPPTKRDGQDGSGLTVDFTFDDAAPPFAVEVTRLRDDFEVWDADDVGRFKARINRQAKANGWPTDWSIGLSPETSFKADLAPAVERMLEWMVATSLDRLGPGSWSADVPTELFQRLQSVKGRDFTKECRDARLKGVILIERLQANGILVIPVVESSDHQSLQRPNRPGPDGEGLSPMAPRVSSPRRSGSIASSTPNVSGRRRFRAPRTRHPV